MSKVSLMLSIRPLFNSILQTVDLYQNFLFCIAIGKYSQDKYFMPELAPTIDVTSWLTAKWLKCMPVCLILIYLTLPTLYSYYKSLALIKTESDHTYKKKKRHQICIILNPRSTCYHQKSLKEVNALVQWWFIFGFEKRKISLTPNGSRQFLRSICSFVRCNVSSV